MVDRIGPLLQQEFKKVSYPTNPPEIWLRSNEDYLAFESRHSTVKDVWDALKDENIYMIGVYGMGGLGKTTFVQEVGRQAEKDKLFKEIVFVEVTETLDVKKVQTEIADKLGLKFNNESERASKLYERLKSGKKILLILDNIWKDLDLKTIGIPSKMDRGGCKLLLTTRNLDALEKMGSTNNFRMGVLNEEEAWTLFKKMGGNVIQTPELNSLPNDVCKECGGLPIVICTIAKALRNKKEESQWEDALRELRMPSPAKFPRVLKREYYKIKLSYDYLEGDELKKTFLISSLMENNTSISDLFKNIVGLGILEGANLTIEEARNRLDLVVKELKDSCLLLDGSTKGRFSMHDVVRVVAITCGYTNHHMFTERNDVESEWKDKDKLRECTIISVVDNNIITQLWNEGLDCPKLEFFDMSNQYSSVGIPEEFFTVMPKLKVLNLFRIQQSSLPSSLDLLTNLQTLCVDDSSIEDIAIIGKLKKLKVLSLRNTNVEELPTEMGRLTQLRLLDLSNCEQLEVIAPNVISKLSQLEELYMKGCCIQWKVEELKELKHLSQLTSLEIDIKDNKMLPKDFFFKELRRYKITIGDSPLYLSMDYELLSRMLEFKYDSSISLEELRIFKNVELLQLVEFSDDDNNLTPLFNKKVNFSNLMALELKVTSSRKIWDSQPPTFLSSLTHLRLHGCRNIKYAFPVSTAKSLSTLQDLQISNCRALEEIVADEGAKTVVNFAFPQVTSLKLEYLPKLIAFYHRRDIWELPMLKRLVVRECEKFTSKYLSFQENSLHISEPNSFCLEHQINFRLEEFDLEHKGNIKWQSRSKTLEIFHDYKLANTLLGLLQKFENLEVLQLKACGYKEIFSWGKDEKHMQITLRPSLATFQYLKVLRVDCCNELKKLITPSTARSLVQLREMSLKSCHMLIEIVENEGEGDATTSTEIVFDNLKKLSLRWLGNLVCFCSRNYSFNFPSLEELIIGECPDMKTFSQGILSTPKLHKVNYESYNETKAKWDIMEVENEENDLNKTIKGAYKNQDISLDLKLWTFKDINSREICYSQHPNSFYQNLTHLILSGCENIKYAFPSSIAKSLHQLQYLKINNCKVLQEIVAKGANEDDNFVFPHVTSLKLECLPEFTAFCHTFEWPMLKELVVNSCGKFITSKYLSSQENNEGELHLSEQKSLFLNDMMNSDLERLELCNEIEMITWQSQSKVLEINYDQSASIALEILHRFENLKELKLYKCKYKEIFSCGKEEKHTGRPTHQQINSLSDLPNLEVLDIQWCDGLKSLVPSSVSLQNLKVLRVTHCKGLMKLMTHSMVRSLVQLRDMSIIGCEMLIEIVENKGEVDATTTITEIVFNNLKKLSLQNLESLTFFCSGNYSFNFPSLEELFIYFCPSMNTFSRGILSTPKLHKIRYDWAVKDLKNGGSELNTTIQQARKAKVDSNLTALRLSEGDIIRIWQGELPKNSGKVKTLQLIKDESTNIPIQILQKFSRLEELKLQGSSYEEIFSCNEDEEHVRTLTKLKVLELLRLFNLKCFWKQDSRLNSILQNLYRLEVQYCHNLTTLLPSSASFENLRTLEIKYCNGLGNLVSSSTARSLVQLVSLRVGECEMMIEALANEGDTEEGTIVFEKLEYLYMYKLESLTCFCSGSYTLKFPNLERLDIYQCSKMKTFSEGDLSMPRLEKLNYKDCSESDLDTIIQELQNDCSEFCEKYKPFHSPNPLKIV
ncbi:uncharacterized protein LOC116112287 [Pistacia vera]|uniref:uncharacterized protein LOC116112287 n=1 Tax=Pistacia vera TaxID=55513 RepID=UPI0012636B52|nr:uncharacterized protein LOC116112287 [Pistacia vera]